MLRRVLIAANWMMNDAFSSYGRQLALWRSTECEAPMCPPVTVVARVATDASGSEVKAPKGSRGSFPRFARPRVAVRRRLAFVALCARPFDASDWMRVTAVGEAYEGLHGVFVGQRVWNL